MTSLKPALPQALPIVVVDQHTNKEIDDEQRANHNKDNKEYQSPAIVVNGGL